ncbi:uncharacterized protein LOC122064790 [Macadamia integrifolia]|uniref:uncharacterized protein LOC122064790 n=1 Tax=Macadamia integrifolia TaxID=60698 RepID=UPI001C4FA027|nr:uncharacterized protein LOC122064790 [Macadamia integrifolia]
MNSECYFVVRVSERRQKKGKGRRRRREEEEEDYEEEEGYGNDGCACFRFFCVGRRHKSGIERVSLLQQVQGENSSRDNESLWRRKLKELKEITELLCGPKWKNFIRKLSVYANKRRRRRTTVHLFQYDPQSYALNFDHGGDEDDQHGSRLDFSSRFAAPPSKMNTTTA